MALINPIDQHIHIGKTQTQVFEESPTVLEQHPEDISLYLKIGALALATPIVWYGAQQMYKWLTKKEKKQELKQVNLIKENAERVISDKPHDEEHYKRRVPGIEDF
jgi:hypothetical protein